MLSLTRGQASGPRRSPFSPARPESREGTGDPPRSLPALAAPGTVRGPARRARPRAPRPAQTAAGTPLTLAPLPHHEPQQGQGGAEAQRRQHLPQPQPHLPRALPAPTPRCRRRRPGTAGRASPRCPALPRPPLEPVPPAPLLSGRGRGSPLHIGAPRATGIRTSHRPAFPRQTQAPTPSAAVKPLAEPSRKKPLDCGKHGQFL